MRINHNLAALNTQRQLTNNTALGQRSLEKLSSGLRINKAGDDAAGLVISEKMRGQIRGLEQASRNAQDAISMLQTAEGALNETHSILQRMRELAVQSTSDTNMTEDRENIQKEVDALVTEINRISTTTEFNTKKLLNGGLSRAYTATSEVLTNSSQSANIATALDITSLQDADGNSLGMLTSDTITINYTKNGTNYTVAAASYSGMSALFAAVEGSTGQSFTSSAAGSITATAGAAGITSAIGGLTIVVKDSSGNIRQAATEAMSGFSVSTQARDEASNSSATIQIGSNASQSMIVDVDKMDAANLKVQGLKITTSGQANSAINALDYAIKEVSVERSKIGAFQNRLDHTINNLGTSAENITAAESRVRDVDMAKEMMEFTKNNILTQAAQAMLAQANQAPQGVLQLLR
jgi:flagellin